MLPSSWLLIPPHRYCCGYLEPQPEGTRLSTHRYSLLSGKYVPKYRVPVHPVLLWYCQLICANRYNTRVSHPCNDAYVLMCNCCVSLSSNPTLSCLILACTLPCHAIPSHPVPSSIMFNPIPSRPIPFHPTLLQNIFIPPCSTLPYPTLPSNHVFTCRCDHCYQVT